MLKDTYMSHTEEYYRICIIKWDVSNLHKFVKERGIKEFQTQDITAPCKDLFNSRFRLKIKIVGEDNYYIEIYYSSPTPVCAKLILTYINGSGSGPIVDKDYLDVPENNWQSAVKMPTKDFYNLYSRNVLALNFKFVVKNYTNKYSLNNSEIQMSAYLEPLFKEGLFSEVITMKSVDGKEFKVHKAILAGRSDVMKAQFEHEHLMSKSNILESPFDSLTLIELLQFIYSDKVSNINGIPEKLLVAADYYQIGYLKNLCEEALHKKLTVENAMETLRLADKYTATTLKHLTIEFIKNGNSKLITETAGWKEDCSADLIKYLYEQIL